jgi:hypothetical protein
VLVGPTCQNRVNMVCEIEWPWDTISLTLDEESTSSQTPIVDACSIPYSLRPGHYRCAFSLAIAPAVSTHMLTSQPIESW